MRALLVVLLLAAFPALADGPSFLGLCNPTWPCSKTLQIWEGQPSITTGWLEESFGYRCRCANLILKDPRPKVIRVHLTNLTCVRGGRFCGRHEFMHGYTSTRMSKRILADSKRVLRRFDRALNRFKRRIENVAQLSCYVSPSLESTLYEGARIKLLARVAAALPGCGLVDNIVRGHCVPGTICERHGIDPGSTLPCIADLDGLDGRTIDLATYKKNAAQCILKFYWEPALNCIKESFVLPNERICTVRKTLFTRLGDICRFLRA